MKRWGVLGKTATGAVLALALAILLVSLYAHANANPVGNCFNGTFDEDPVICHAFEQAYAADKLDIEAIYQGGGALFVYLAGSEPVEDDVYDFLHSRAQEEAWRSGEHQCFLEDNCWQASLRVAEYFILPPSAVYEYIFLRPGGVEALKTEPGSPAFRELWPADPGANDNGSTRSAADVVDTSSVDTANIPPLDCRTQVDSVVFGGCRMWAELPAFGIAGIKESPNRAYYQVKVRPEEEEADLEAALAAIHRRVPAYDDDEVVVIPVKYDYEELAGWALLLDRFSKTSGNTIGITDARLGENFAAYRGETVFLSAGPPELPIELYYDFSRYRTIIHIETLELEQTLAVLPQLLAQLNIPADAVGLVHRVDRTPLFGRITPDEGTLEESPDFGTSFGTGASAEQWAYRGLLAAAVAITVLALALLVTRRMRRPAS